MGGNDGGIFLLGNRLKAIKNRHRYMDGGRSPDERFDTFSLPVSSLRGIYPMPEASPANFASLMRMGVSLLRDVSPLVLP